MSSIRVWAPNAGRVDLVVAGSEQAMDAQEGGWWRAESERLRPGADYAFRLDGGEPRPDPRSRWQPQGVHGASRVDDPSAFRWSDDGFRAPPLSAALIYELHLGTFSPEGTLDGAAARLDHLLELGVTHVQLMPVNAFSGRRGWGYDGVGLYAVHDAYGGPEALRRFVDTCHGRGLAVLLDVVYNHLGPEGNYLAEFGPYFTERYHTPWGAAVNLDQPGSDEARRFFLDNALMWLRDYHIDGLRLDAVHAFLDESAVHILEALATEVEALSARLGKPLVLIAESDLADPRLLRPREVGGYALDAQWSDDFHHALHALLTGERSGYYADYGSLDHLATTLRQAWVDPGGYSIFRGRRHGRPHGGLPGHQFLGYSQTHDQVGNRAVGERLCHLVSPGKARVAAALTFAAPFVPMLFMGEEWAASTPFQYFTDHGDPALGEAVSRGRRREFRAFGWKPEAVPDPQDEATFRRSLLRWDELGEEPHASMLDFYRSLAALRRREGDLRDGRLSRVRVEVDDARRWIRVGRGSVEVVANLDAEPCEVPTTATEILLASSEGAALGDGAATLPGESALFLRAPQDEAP